MSYHAVVYGNFTKKGYGYRKNAKLLRRRRLERLADRRVSLYRRGDGEHVIKRRKK